TLTYTYQVADTCGNLLEDETITYSGSDQTAPTGTAPQGQVDVDACVSAAETAVPFDAAAVATNYTDNCAGAVTVTLTNTELTGNDCAWTLTYTYQVADTCGNLLEGETITHTGSNQAPIVFDTLPPTETLLVSSCEPLPTAAIITASKGCGDVEVYVDELRIDGSCFGNYTIERRWVAIDECGNQTVSDVQLIEVTDEEGPTWNEAVLPQNMTLQACAPDFEIPAAAVLTATDCTYDIDNDADGNFRLDGSLLLQIQEASNGYSTLNGDPFGVVGTYLVNDYLYTYAPGTQSPAIPNPLPEFDGITFTITTVDVSENGAPSYVAPSTFGAGFRFQNARIEITFSNDVFFTVNGNTQVALRAQSYIEYSGDGNILVPYPNVGSHNDPNLISSTSGPYYLYNPNIFNPSQPNLNRVSDARTIYGGVGTSVNVEHRHPFVTGTGYTQIFELQLFPQQDLVTFEEEIVAGSCANNYEVIRTWTAVDECGNETTHVQTITVEDATAPVFNETLPTDITVSCESVPAGVVLTATDNCGTATVSFTET
ncbi:hypothetical protein MM236_17240, partial [Belliella sp. DSM 107340]